MAINMAEHETIRIYADTSVLGSSRKVAIYSPLEVIEYED